MSVLNDEYTKIAIIGCPGSGKSTLAEKLHAILKVLLDMNQMR